MTLIDGKALAQTIHNEVAHDVATLSSPPGLGVLLVGDDDASHVYVNLKEKAAKKAGIHTDIQRLPAEVSDDALEQVIRVWNGEPTIHGILLQLPLPPGHDTDRLIAAIDPAKDVDGFHPETIRRLREGQASIISPVHEAVLRLIAASGLDPRQKACTILANSDTFSAPLAYLLQRAGFVTAVMHPEVLDARVLQTSDVIVSAVGRAGFIGPDLVKPGAVLVDVGTTKDALGRVCGDMDAAALATTPGFLTPVPGGVGPMTVALLLKNLVRLSTAL
ncbi:MAG: 5,10-methylene-tetrahydrofolate dehydrogenase/Methenyl tetrahydrofolate cyclohydrolase [Candidatus Parcubacteria bacterium]|jgi:methylenetetrahydrofolate dehydrogenase (NADP+)/methenyltetrahydrofolate cyclohydrolase